MTCDSSPASSYLSVGQLEEYKTLRKEILEFEKQQHELLLAIYTGLFATFTIAFYAKNHYLLLLVFIVLIPLKLRHIHLQAAMFKISAYIQLFIESNHSDMQWETYTHVRPIENTTSSSTSLQFFIHTIIAIITCVFISLKINPSIFFTFTVRYTLIDLLLIFISIILTFIVYLLDKYLYKYNDSLPSFRKKWEEVRGTACTENPDKSVGM